MSNIEYLEKPVELPPQSGHLNLQKLVTSAVKVLTGMNVNMESRIRNNLLSLRSGPGARP